MTLKQQSLRDEAMRALFCSLYDIQTAVTKREPSFAREIKLDGTKATPSKRSRRRNRAKLN